MANSAKPASGCLIVFAIPFLLGGAFFAIVSYRSIGDPKFQNPGVGIAVGCGVALLGALLMMAGFKVAKSAKLTSAAQAAYPDQPWMWRDDWAQGRLKGQGGRRTAIIWVFAMLWNGIAWTMVTAALHRPMPRGQWMGYVVLAIFPLAGIALLVTALKGTIRSVRFGSTTLQLQKVPVSLGRTLQGNIDARLPYPLPHGIQMKLSCINRVSTGSGNDRSTWDNVLWQDTKTIGAEQVMAGPNGSTIPVQFEIPRDKPASDSTKPGNQILWLLRAEADVPGANFSDEYEVPVFETRESPSVAEWQTQAQAEERSHPPTAPIRPTVQISPAPEGGTQFYFPAGRNVSAAFGVTFFALLFGGIDVALFYFQGQFRPLLFFGILFGLFALLLTLIAVNLWFGTAKIVANSAGISFKSSVLGMGGSKQWTAAEIQSVYPKITMQSGSGGQAVAYYTITLEDRSGHEAALGNALRDHNEAEWICLQIRQMTNIQARSMNG